MNAGAYTGFALGGDELFTMIMNVISILLYQYKFLRFFSEFMELKYQI